MYLAKRNNTNFFDDFFKSPFLGAVEQVGGSRLMKTDVKEVIRICRKRAQTRSSEA